MLDLLLKYYDSFGVLQRLRRSVESKVPGIGSP